MRLRRRYLAIPVFLMVLAALLIVRFNAVNQPSSQGVASLPSPHCQKGDPLAGVYNPSRFLILSNCLVAGGVVETITLLQDGDQRIGVRLDSQYAGLLVARNSVYLNGLFVAQLASHNKALGPLPSVGQNITFVGPLVYDIENRWNAIYPVWWIGID